VKLDVSTLANKLPLICIPLVNQITHHIPCFIYRDYGFFIIEKNQNIIEKAYETVAIAWGELDEK